MATPVSNSTPSVFSPDLLNAVSSKKPQPVAGSVEADTNKFMTLLVTQLKNQDPMNPLDNAQITSQLAQLSTVTGVNKLNTTLESLKASYQSAEGLQAANMIGHGVLVDGTGITLQGGKAILGAQLGSAADNLQVIISDASGKDVQVMDMGKQAAGSLPIVWDGIVDPAKVDAAGKPVVLPDGHYSFRVVATQGGAKLTDAKGLTFDSVASVTTSATDGVKLNLAGKGVVGMADVRQIL
jgi:flagellar basal-body rod modification protein FlgD